MSNIDEPQPPKSWIITLERADGSMLLKSVHTTGETLSEAAQIAEMVTPGSWVVVAGRLLR